MRVIDYSMNNFVFLLKCYRSPTQRIIFYLSALLAPGEEAEFYWPSIGALPDLGNMESTGVHDKGSKSLSPKASFILMNQMVP